MSDELASGLLVAREFIPARVRRAVYALGSVCGYLLAAAVVGFTVAGVETPLPLAVALGVLGALMGPLGQLAAANTPRDLPVLEEEAGGLDDA